AAPRRDRARRRCARRGAEQCREPALRSLDRGPEPVLTHILRRGHTTPLHRHDFAQVWYILEGEFRIGATTYGPGTMIWHADPHYEEELHTDSGGLMLIVQYPGPSTGARPIYDDRFNLQQRKRVEEERTDA